MRLAVFRRLLCPVLQGFVRLSIWRETCEGSSTTEGGVLSWVTSGIQGGRCGILICGVVVVIITTTTTTIIIITIIISITIIIIIVVVVIIIIITIITTTTTTTTTTIIIIVVVVVVVIVIIIVVVFGSGSGVPVVMLCFFVLFFLCAGLLGSSPLPDEQKPPTKVYLLVPLPSPPFQLVQPPFIASQTYTRQLPAPSPCFYVMLTGENSPKNSASEIME